jgi:hypothetical protein
MSHPPTFRSRFCYQIQRRSHSIFEICLSFFCKSGSVKYIFVRSESYFVAAERECELNFFSSIVTGFDFSFCTQNFFYAISSLYGSTRLNRSDRSAETDKPNPSKPKPSLGRCGQYIFTHSLGRMVFLGPHRPNPNRCPPLMYLQMH